MEYLIQTYGPIDPAILKRASLDAVQTVLGIGVEAFDSPKTTHRGCDCYFLGRLVLDSENPFSIVKKRFGSVIAYHSSEFLGTRFRQIISPDCLLVLDRMGFFPDWLLRLELNLNSREQISSIAKLIETTTPGVGKIAYSRIPGC